MSDLKLTPPLLSMLERIEKHSGTLLMLAITASGGQDGKLNKLRGAGYVVKCDHASVTEGGWPAKALAITEAGRAALAKHHAEVAEKKGQRPSGDKRVIFRRDGERYIVFLGDHRIGFVGLGTTSTLQWRIPVTPRPEKDPVSYCAAAMSVWFEKARYDGQNATSNKRQCGFSVSRGSLRARPSWTKTSMLRGRMASRRIGRRP